MSYASCMSIGSALKPVWSPFASVLINGKRGAKLADVGYAGVIVGAATALITGAAIAHGRSQAALLWIGAILVVLALVLATIAALRKEPARETQAQDAVNGQGRSSTDDWDGSIEESDEENRQLEKELKAKRHLPGSDSS